MGVAVWVWQCGCGCGCACGCRCGGGGGGVGVGVGKRRGPPSMLEYCEAQGTHYLRIVNFYQPNLTGTTPLKKSMCA